MMPMMESRAIRLRSCCGCWAVQDGSRCTEPLDADKTFYCPAHAREGRERLLRCAQRPELEGNLMWRELLPPKRARTGGGHLCPEWVLCIFCTEPATACLSRCHE